ncbi:plasma membrane iron permease [Myxozyma melibiosi]|uniref:Plasma membrane iron permease n=1 Tax=Myxozyma melibiosi TaxID=54550 RepID=A0ABR1FE72_9ASCO
MAQVFEVSVFFIVFRETLEASIIISVLLAFLKQGIGRSMDDPVIYKRLVKHVWVGSAIGFLVCLCIGGAFIGAWYSLGRDVWGSSEDLWEGIFSIIATVIISIMGLAMLRLNKLKEKWRVKIAAAMEERNRRGRGMFGRFTRKYAMAILPLITVLREGVEAIVFVGGVSLTAPAKAFPLPVICGMLAGSAIGYLMYKGGDFVKIQYFLIIATCFLYLVGAGLFSKACWYFQNHNWVSFVGSDVSEEGSGAGSYDVRQSVWHVNCCNGETDGGWMIFNALFGWQNSATYGSVIGYNCYWIAVMVSVALMLYKEKKGYFPFLKSWTEKHEAKKIAKRRARMERIRAEMEEEEDRVEPKNVESDSV